MLGTIGLLFASFVLILLSAELFTNAVEWFGKKLKLGEGAVGSVVAAVGTALPETSISIVAIIAAARHGSAAASRHAAEIGIGAILGAPMMLATLAMFITGASVLVFSAMKKRPINMRVNYQVIGRDLRTFILVYAVAIGASRIPSKEIKVIIGCLLIFAYFVYVARTFAGTTKPAHGHKHEHHDEEEEDELKPLHFHRSAISPRLRFISIQIIAGIALMVTGAHYFLESVTEISRHYGLSPLVLSLIIAPIATELPEKFNSITWVRQRKDTLALGNISGAMVFQSTITPAVGIFFTSWVLDLRALASAVIALAATAIIVAEMMWKKRISPYSLLVGGLFYALYPIYVFGFAK
jgi:cation:H+ antiporter